MLDLRRLRLLREVHARGTLHAAAGALGYTASAISQQLATLEREAGTPLLERSGRNVRLTAAGQVLLKHASILLVNMEAAEAELAEVAAGSVAGVVRIAAFQSALLRIVAPAIGALTTSHPDIRLEVTEAEVEQSAPSLKLQHLDIVVGDEYDNQPRALHPEFHRHPVLRECINLVIPADHAEAAAATPRLAQLASIPWATCQPGTGHHQMHLRVTRQLGGFEPDIRYTSDDFQILLELVRTTGAGALLPDLALAHHTPGVVARPFLEGDVGREVYLLTRPTRTPAVTAVAEALHHSASRALPTASSM